MSWIKKNKQKKENRDATHQSHSNNCSIPSYSRSRFTLPGEVCIVQLLKVTRRGGIEHIDFTAVLLLSIDVVNQLVHILVPQVGIFILEIWAHGHDDVIALINCRLQGDKEKNCSKGDGKKFCYTHTQCITHTDTRSLPGCMCLCGSDTNLSFGNLDELHHHIANIIVL